MVLEYQHKTTFTTTFGMFCLEKLNMFTYKQIIYLPLNFETGLIHMSMTYIATPSGLNPSNYRAPLILQRLSTRHQPPQHGFIHKHVISRDRISIEEAKAKLIFDMLHPMTQKKLPIISNQSLYVPPSLACSSKKTLYIEPI